MYSVSVITICFNNLGDLQRTCWSVDTQSLLPGEHWIINGSTENNIADWLNNTPQPTYRKWLNERDNGIADAFNKGIARSSLPVIHLLNSGDIYASDDVLETVVRVFETQPDPQWLSGKIQMLRAGEKVIVGKPFDSAKLYRGMRSISHPTWFLKKEVYHRVGNFKDYKIAMDYDLMCRIKDEPYVYLDKVLTIFDDTGISSSNYLKSLKENRVVYESYFGYSLKLVVWQLRLKVLYHLLQTSFGKWLFSLKRILGLENM